jgi:plasmid rolling circle replication initiator protein Rep
LRAAGASWEHRDTLSWLPGAPPRREELLDALRGLDARQRAERAEPDIFGRLLTPADLRPWFKRAARYVPPRRSTPLLDTLETSRNETRKPAKAKRRQLPQVAFVDTDALPYEKATARHAEEYGDARELKDSRRRTDLRRRTEAVAAILSRYAVDELQARQADALRDCGSRYGVMVDPVNGERLGVVCTRCRVRACPGCAAQRAAQVRTLVRLAVPEILEAWPSAQFVMLTLTLRNVPLESLGDTYRQISKAFSALTRQRGCRKGCRKNHVHRKAWPALGYLRFLETTRGRDGSAHPHVHALLMVDGEYFSDRGDGARYVSWEQWGEAWREALGVDYRPVVDVRKIRPTRKTLKRLRLSGKLDTLTPAQLTAECVRDAVCEVAKYPLKISRGALEDPEWLAESLHQTRNVRAWQPGGWFASALRGAKRIRDEERAERDAALEGRAVAVVWWTWNGADYLRAPSDRARAWTAALEARTEGAFSSRS